MTGKILTSTEKIVQSKEGLVRKTPDRKSHVKSEVEQRSPSGTRHRKSSTRSSRRTVPRRKVTPEPRPGNSKMAKAATTRRSSKNDEKPGSEREKPTLTVDTKTDSKEIENDTPRTAASTPTPKVGTPSGVRGRRDIRSPGQTATPTASVVASPEPPIPDFITQTDEHGNATTPRSQDAIQQARQIHPSGPKPHLHVDKEGKLTEEDDTSSVSEDACDTLFDSIRLMCCCLLSEVDSSTVPTKPARKKVTRPESPVPLAQSREDRVSLLGKHHPDDFGKKCLVLDLDETLVHSSFRAVTGADFVIPVQIEDVVHFVYVMKRPGVDEFLTEMAKHYEIVIYTASLNKYADPLLDLLDPNRVIRTRLFRESCVYYEGSYVKDLSLLDRDLSQAIIVDNSPSSYIFHPENAIDCSSFIDDPADRELDQIGAFLTGIKDIPEVRHTCNRWREWPNIKLPQPEDEEEEKGR